MADQQANELDALERILSNANEEPTALSYTLIKSITGNFSDEIGRGGFGVVYKGVLQNGNVAVKKLSASHDLSDKQFLDEINCLIRVKHHNIVRFLGYCSDTQGQYVKVDGKFVMAEVRQRLLVFEYVPSGSLQDYLTGECYGDGWQIRYQIIKDICAGLNYLHKECINHLDLKPDNVLLGAHKEAKITDFGLSRCFDEGQSRLYTNNVRGTPGYMAPEIIDRGEISFKSDIYCLGIIIIKLSAGRDMSNVENFREHNVGFAPVRSCIEIARRCMDMDKDKRPIVGEILHRLDEMDINMQKMSLVTPTSRNEPASSTYQLTGQGTKENKGLHIKDINKEILNEEVCKRFDLLDVHDGSPLVKSSLKTDVTDWRSSLGHPPMKKQEGTEPSVVKEIGSKIRVEDWRSTWAPRFIKEREKDHLNVTKEVLFEPIIVKNEITKATSVDVHPTEPWIIANHGDQNVRIWNYQTQEVRLFEITPSTLRVTSVKFIPRKQWIVAGDNDGSIYVYSYHEQKIMHTLRGHSSSVETLEIHATEPYVLSASLNDRIMLWNYEKNWELVKSVNLSGSCLRRVAFEPKGTDVFATAMGSNVQIWDLRSFECKHTLLGHSHIVMSLDYFVRGNDLYLITGSIDRTAKVWDCKTWNCVETIDAGNQLGQGHVTEVCSHPDFPILITCLNNGTVLLWDSTTFRLMGSRDLNLGSIQAIRCMKGSTRIVAACERGLVLVEMGMIMKGKA